MVENFMTLMRSILFTIIFFLFQPVYAANEKVNDTVNITPSGTAVVPTSATTTTTTTALPVPVGKVIWVKGSFKAIMPNQEERNLQKASIIYEHDTLVTGNNSQAQIAFTDNTLMTFRTDTTFYIDKYKYNASPNNSSHSVGSYVMNLVEGGFRTVTGAIAKNNPSDYKVNTPVATIGVRGTDYSIYVHDGEIYIGYIQGSPCMTSKKSSDVKNNTLCLSQDKPYGYIPQNGAIPVPISQRPPVFQEKLPVTPATVAPFSGGAPADSSAPSQAPVPQVNPTTPITSFCISS